MPDTFDGLLVIILAMLPGVPGNQVYQRLVGKSRKEEQWGTVVRIVGFSVAGLIIYIILGSYLGAPIPTYISPNTFVNFALERSLLVNMSAAFAGHTIGAVIAAVVAAPVVLALNRWSRSTDLPDTWDRFISECVPDRWVVTTLKGGETYAGILARADASVGQDERDLVLKEPALYSERRKNYIATSYQYLFVPGYDVVTVGVASNLKEERITKVGTPIFAETREKKETTHARPKRR